MTKAETRTWYRIALATKSGAPELVLASGEHMGQAIAEAQEHLRDSFPVAVEHASAEQIPLGESVGKGHVIKLGPAPEVPVFQWPIGVLPSLPDAAKCVGARRGWVEHADDKMLVVEAQTEADQLTDLFLGLIEKLPSADNLEVRVLDHFEDAKATDVWLTSRVNAKKILRFLDDYEDELLGNGHLEISVYVRQLRATLRLTEHKTVVWIAEDRALATEIAGWLRELGVLPIDKLVSVRDGAHFHYRGPKSRNRVKLGEELYRQRLRKVDTLTKRASS